MNRSINPTLLQTVGVSTMNCVRYDISFQKYLIAKSKMSPTELSQWYLHKYRFKKKMPKPKKPPQEEKPKVDPTSPHDSDAGSPVAQRKQDDTQPQPKRRRAMSSVSESSESDQERGFDDDTSSPVELWSYTARGTKSRPVAARRFGA